MRTEERSSFEERAPPTKGAPAKTAKSANDDDDPPFRIPFMPWPCVLSIIVNCYLICGLPVHALQQSIYFCLLCCVVWLLYSRSHSKLNEVAAYGRFEERSEDVFCRGGGAGVDGEGAAPAPQPQGVPGVDETERGSGGEKIVGGGLAEHVLGE